MSLEEGRSRLRRWGIWIALGSAAMLLVVAFSVRSWERTRLRPYLDIRPGMAIADVRARLGPPVSQLSSYPDLLELARRGSWVCHQVDGDLPGGLTGLLPCTGQAFEAEASPSARILPEPSGPVLAYFPFFYLVLVYSSETGSVDWVLLCGT